MRKYLTAIAVALLAAVTGAHAQDYPNKPIRLILGNPAGGSTDISARLLAEKIRGLLGQAVVVENRTGASTLIATQAVSQAAPDGYTLLWAGGSVATGPSLSKAWTLDGTKDLTPISQMVRGVNLIGVPPSAPYKTVDEWIAYMKANPGKLNYANISATDLVGFEMIKNTMGVKYETVRYNGATPAQAAVLAGQADFYAVPIGNIAKGLLETGRIKFLSVLASERSSIMPQIPSFADSVHPELRELGKFSGVGQYWFGLFGPPNLPKPLVNTLYQVAVKVSADPDWVKKVTDLGLTVVTNTPDAFTALLINERTRFAIEAKKAGIAPQ